VKKHLMAALGIMLIGGSATATPAEPGDPATGSTIVYSRSAAEHDLGRAAEIFAMQEDGSGMRRLTDNRRRDDYPALSPDGTLIAFSRKIDGQFDLFVMSTNGENRRRLTRTPEGDEVLAAWAPDGTALAFTVTTNTPGGWQSDIYRMTLSDRRVQRLTFTPRAQEFTPAWAPDDSEIAFTKFNLRRHRYGIASVNPNAGGLRWIVVNPRSGDGYADANPSWSPDSQWLVFARDHGSDPYVDLYKIRRDGSDVTAVTDLSGLAEDPDWGPDGRILFRYEEGLAIVTDRGGTPEQITPVRSGLPYWSPDW